MESSEQLVLFSGTHALRFHIEALYIYVPELKTYHILHCIVKGL